MNSFHHVVKEEEKNSRVDRLLRQLIANTSRNQIQKMIEDGLITVNQQTIKSNYKCQIDDEIVLEIPVKQEVKIEPENISLDIMYEDNDLLVLNKRKGMVVHPTADHQHGTLVNALLYHTDQLSTRGGAVRPGIVHRIDKDTSGLLVVAKNNDSHLHLAEQLQARTMVRVYEAIVHGVIDHVNGLIDAPIGRDPNNRLQMEVVTGGKPAVTHFKVLDRYDEFTYVTCELETGRTHQIRVHMNYIGHPLVGDPKYTKRQTIHTDGQALFAKKLGFLHPSLDQWMEFEVDQPDYFTKLLKEIKERS